MIKIENLSFKYKEGEYILKDINLEIKQGQSIALVGKNGSGKSTLAKLISGIIKPTKGLVMVDEINTKDKKEYINLRKKIGVVFQNPENQILFNNLDDEISFALNNLNLDNKELRINEALKKVKIEKEKTLNIEVILEDPTSSYKITGNNDLKDGSIIKINTTSKDGSTREYQIVIEKENKIFLYMMLTDP